MRNLIYAINVTMDGCCDHTKGKGGDQLLEYYANLLQRVDLLVYGRITYQLMVPFWPDIAKNNSGQTAAANEFAQAFDAVDKIIVFSQTLDKGEGEKTSIVRSDLKDEILKLKQQPGKDILTGGVALPSQLTALGLVDEYHIVIHPVVAGEGRRLSEGVQLPAALPFKLAASKVLTSGHVALRYLKQ